MDSNQYIISLLDASKQESESLQQVGGKGRSLSRLAQHGFRVPAAFHVTTAAYRATIDRNRLAADIQTRARPELANGRASFEGPSADIQRLIGAVDVPIDIREAIVEAYTRLASGSAAVAVRSSATAEDLPDLSFAGQQETYLNVRGADNVISAVVDCWCSLWTPQAMNYRHENGVDQNDIAMAVVVQLMVESEVSGILFTANPATGERSELVINASFGLGEMIVSGKVTPDTYVVDRPTLATQEEVIGTKDQLSVAKDSGGTREEAVDGTLRTQSSLVDEQRTELCSTAIEIEQLFGYPQDIEWAFTDGELHLLQSRPITNLPVQPIDLDWSVPPPATYVSRRQIVENMPDPICPLFEELYLTEGLESSRKGQSLMVGGGATFIAVNGYAYQRFDFPIVHEQAAEKGLLPLTDQEIDAAEMAAQKGSQMKAGSDKRRNAKTPDPKEVARHAAADRETRERDVERFRESLSTSDRVRFDDWWSDQDPENLARRLSMPESKNPTYVAFNNTEWNDRQLGEWFKTTSPRLHSIREKWQQVEPGNATDEELLEGIREMGIEEGYYWSSNSSHTFGVAKSTDDQLQCFLRETLPDHHFISGQFLSGIESKTMQSNADLYQIAKLIRANDDLSYVVQTTPTKFLFDALEHRNDSSEVLNGIRTYLEQYGHQGYSMDFVEPTQIEDPSALFTSLKAMVADESYDPKRQDARAARTRTEKYEEISALLSGLEYWQFRFRLWLARKYNYIREEVAFLFGYTWSVLRPMVHELGHRLVEVGTLHDPGDLYFLVSKEIKQAIEARATGKSLPELGKVAAERRELREARKRHHPPGTLPAEASQIDGIAFKETQIRNDSDSDVMRGFAVSSGRVTATASVITGPHEFEKMEPGSILVSPLTTPAWTQLFALAKGLVTDVGSILAHGSIVAREYGIPAVLGVGDGTKRIEHGQTLTIDGDSGTVHIHTNAEIES